MKMAPSSPQYSPVDNSPIQHVNEATKSADWSFSGKAGDSNDHIAHTATGSDLKQPSQTINEVQPAREHASFIWWLEVGSCVLLAGGLFGIIATIAWTDGKALSQWPLHLSVNTLIAAFSVLMESLLRARAGRRH